jgi:pyridoxamine 5'-phosphate oxidase
MRSVDDPLTLFQTWLEEARAAMGYDADAMAVATATPDGAPSVRMVLLKGVDDRGLVFFTNYSSRKGSELERNPRAALLFHWQPLGRQVRVEGPVSKVDRAEGEAYARSRPRPSQLSALASPQSAVVPDREWLERRVAELDREYEGRELPVGEHWGGFRLVPETWEFWEHDEARLHDRDRFTRTADGWRRERLAP